MSSAELAAAPAREPGARFLEEIREQPAALLRLLEGSDDFARVAAEIRDRGATTIRMAGHGSSDNAASYGIYAFGLLPGWTALRDSISLIAYYGAELDLSGCTALALSQSGRTPDVVEYARQAKLRGAYVVAFTTRPPSSHARRTRSYLSAPDRSSPSRRRRPTSTRSPRSACSPPMPREPARRSPRAYARLPTP